MGGGERRINETKSREGNIFKFRTTLQCKRPFGKLHHPFLMNFPVEIFAESEVLEAQAQYDFTARSSREVSFRKGDTILLYAQVSSWPLKY